MLGLHNILLIASSQQAQNPHTISSDHHHQNNPPNLNSQDCNFNGSNNPWSLNKCQELSIARKDGGLSVGDESSGSLGTCTDCGNKAKKECKYGRCRTCCKSRGYDCSTHVKSTWIPASKRQERHQVGGGGCSGSSSGGVKRPRIVSSSQNVTTTTTSNSVSSNAAPPPASLCFDTGSSQQDPSFKQSLPGKVKAPAVFRCIRVTAISGEEAEVLYQATVNICGHVFKGFLYNQGVDEKQVYPCISKVHLESSTNGREFSAPIVEPSDAYAASGNRKLFE